ncbi:MAG TPA: hypothetical protein VG649_03755 [Candidatus Angelobacter sp.]|jgi:hypothetical protein|nr:hypothetical protein [Candidatus Angelobacter sp.]
MRIALPPYHAHISPRGSRPKFLWECKIQREGSAEVVSRHELGVKEDACCVALLELTRLLHADTTSPVRPRKSHLT